MTTRVSIAKASSAFYSPRRAFLPVTSQIADHTLDPAEEIGYELGGVAACAELLEELTGDLEAAPLCATQLHERTRAVSDAFGTARRALEPVRDSLLRAYPPERGENALREALTGLDDAVVSGYAMYDRYFHVVRVPNFTTIQFAGQVANTCCDLATELPMSILGLDELLAIMHAMRLLCLPASRYAKPQRFGEESSKEKSPKRPSSSGLRFPAGNGQSVASFRWITGHHFFALCAIQCRSRLVDGMASLKYNDYEGVASALKDANVLLRGTTAAMWYASNFPARNYLEWIRPSMDTANPRGFTGSQNADYKRFLDVKKSLLEELGVLPRSSDGVVAKLDHARDPSGPVRPALIDFLETVVEDTEHHTLIAASKVALRGSLLNKNEPQDQVAAESAVGMLRDMAADRWEQLRGFLG